jgi:Family of unknown function (DUF6152)
MKGFRYLIVIAALLGVSLTAYAHHSFTATYDTGKTVTIEGKVIQFLLRNPHSFLHVTVVDKDGKEQNWNIEWAAAGQLGGAGVTRDSLKVGDAVVITGNPARDPADQRLRMVSVKRTSDGFNWGFRQGQVVD